MSIFSFLAEYIIEFIDELIVFSYMYPVSAQNFNTTYFEDSCIKISNILLRNNVHLIVSIFQEEDKK